jgi:glycine/sarcosine N-methyltransferase
MNFYDDIADSYAELTAAGDRQVAARQFVKELMGRFNIASAVDTACGTGLFAIELARCGVDVVASDISAGMLKAAPANASSAGIDTGLCTWLQAPMQELGDHIPPPRDAVLCMGNSIPHLLTDDDLGGTLGGFAKILRPGGVVGIHLMNYARVLSSNDRIIGITRSGSREFVRFYDFERDFLAFNILEIQWGDDGRCSHKLLTTPHRPYLRGDLVEALSAAGFENIETFGDLRFNPFAPESSDTILLTATRRSGRTGDGA